MKTIIALVSLALAGGGAARAQTYQPAAASGGILGAIAGAFIGGHNHDQWAQGAVLGGVTGALLGAAVSPPPVYQAQAYPPVVYQQAPVYQSQAPVYQQGQAPVYQQGQAPTVQSAPMAPLPPPMNGQPQVVYYAQQQPVYVQSAPQVVYVDSAPGMYYAPPVVSLGFGYFGGPGYYGGGYPRGYYGGGFSRGFVGFGRGFSGHRR